MLSIIAKNKIPVTSRFAAASFNSRNVLNIVLIFSAVCFFGMMIMRFITAYSLDFDLVGVETNVVYSVQALLAGQPLYNNTMQLPFTITQYTPLYYYVCAFTAKWLNLDPATDIHSIYVVGRMWNIFFNLLTVYAVLLMCKNVFRLGNKVSLIAGLCAFVFIFRHDFSFRPDSLQNLLVLWGVYFFFCYLQSISRKRKALLYLTAAFFLGITSIFVKQSGVQLPIIFLMFLLFTLNWRGFFLGAVFSLLFFGAYYLYYNSLYGEAFVQNVVGGVANGISIHGFIVWVIGAKPFILKILVPFLIVAYVVLKKNMLFKGSLEERFLAFCLAGLFGFASITGLKTGATAQYYSLFQYMAWVLIFYFFVKNTDYKVDQAIKFSGGSFKKLAIWGYVIFLLAVNTLYQLYLIKTDELDGKATLVKESRITDEVASYFKNELSLTPDEKVYANLRLAYRIGINNALFEYNVAPQNEIIYFPKTKLEVFGYEAFEESLRTGRVKYLIESEPRNHFKITDNYEALRDTHYRLIKTIDIYSIYEYNY